MTATSSPKYIALRAGAVLAIFFGIASIVSGGQVIFGEEARAAAGDVVDFVVLFNFAAGFVYVAAGVAIFLRHRAGSWLAIGLAVSNVAVLAAFCAHVAAGGAFEPRTAVAMPLRTVLWIVLAWASHRTIGALRNAKA